MSIAKKTLQLKQDFDDVHEAGKQKVISQSKYIPKTASGKVISLTDVSEVYHKVKVVGNGEVDVYGKNLFDGILESGYIDNDGTLKNYNGTVRSTSYITLVPNTSYSLSTKNGNVKLYARFYDADKNGVGNGGVLASTTITFTPPSNSAYFKFYADTSDVATEIQFEFGGATPHEPYTHQTTTATPTGTEIDSMCPNMNFIADEDITVDYYSSYGMQTEYDRLWDSYQDNGARTDYTYTFSGYGWKDDTFKPKYDIKPTQATGMFNGTKITDLVVALERTGVALDTTNTTNSASLFRSTFITRVPYFIAPTGSGGTHMFYGAYSLHTIEGIKCSETTVYGNWFYNCTKLTHVIFSGIIANDINLQWSPLLDEESLQSLTQSLADFIMLENNPDGTNIPEGQAFTKTITLSPESWAILDNLEFIPPEGTNYPTGFSCATIITTAKGWNKA